MIKLVMCLCRRSDITREQFQEYWLNEHGPFFTTHAGDMRARRYVQSVTIDTPLNAALRESTGMLPEYDGVAELRFDSEQEEVNAISTAEGQMLGAALLEDEKNFLDHADRRPSRSGSMSIEGRVGSRSGRAMAACWGDDVPPGELTSFPMAVQCGDDETVVFSWILWPSREAREVGMNKVMDDPRMQADVNPMPFDGKRLIYAGFEVLVDQ